MKDDSQILLTPTFQSLFCRLDQFTERMEAPSPSSTPSSSSPDDESEDDAIITLVHNSTQTLGVLKKAMVDMSWMDLMTKDDMEERRKRLNVFKTVLRELSKCCTDVQVGLKSAQNGAIGKEITSSFCFHFSRWIFFLFILLSVGLSQLGKCAEEYNLWLQVSSWHDWYGWLIDWFIYGLILMDWLINLIYCDIYMDVFNQFDLAISQSVEMLVLNLKPTFQGWLI